MAYWDTKETCLAELVKKYDLANGDKIAFLAYLPWIQGAIDAGDALLACSRIKSALTILYAMSYYLISSDENYTPPYMPLYYLSKYTMSGWKSIVEAWVKDDFEGRLWTIGVIDRMRQILWDEPFDLTWAARPEEKEIG